MNETTQNRRSRLAVDIGGTFTDLVGLSEQGEIVYSKSLTTYDNLARGVFECIRKGSVDVGDLAYFVHGSTIAINTVIQLKGARTGLITTQGFRDVYEIGRSNRPDAYNLDYRRPQPLIPRELRTEVIERMDATGAVRTGLDEASVREAVQDLKARGVGSIAVVLLHAYANPKHEIRVGEIVREEFPDCDVSLSHEILREFREYERTSTTALNAYVAPIVSRYIHHLEQALSDAKFSGQFMIMQSNGGTMSSAVAKEIPAAMMESGPVAGVIGAGKLGELIGLDNIISFDMGGTTAKASLVTEGEARVVTGYHIGGYMSGHPMMLPVVDIVEVGTGGGSIAWRDTAGGLKVGPLSAGSDPGPVCYGNGGEEPTVTDANLVLGRLNAENFLGGEMALDLEGARRAIQKRIGDPLGLGVEEAALGIIRIADAKMSLAVREVSVAKGLDPRDFALVATGGAGPLHAVAIARELSIPKVVIPELPGTFSAFGMLFADVRHDYVRTYIRPLKDLDVEQVNAGFEAMASTARDTLAGEAVPPSRTAISRSVDLRYRGQEYTLTVDLAGDRLDAEAISALRARFDELHQAKYQHAAPNEAVEMVNLRLTAIGTLDSEGMILQSRPEQDADGKPVANRPVVFESGTLDCPVYARTGLAANQIIIGPAIIEEKASTTVLHPGDRATRHPAGPLIIELGA